MDKLSEELLCAVCSEVLSSRDSMGTGTGMKERSQSGISTWKSFQCHRNRRVSVPTRDHP